MIIIAILISIFGLLAPTILYIHESKIDTFHTDNYEIQFLLNYGFTPKQILNYLNWKYPDNDPCNVNKRDFYKYFFEFKLHTK